MNRNRANRIARIIIQVLYSLSRFMFVAHRLNIKKGGENEQKQS